ncbi:Gluconokinase [Fasciola gigantica]|uniref:Gluconokinase n=2 Tax=Fasciola TaxID=6191 RepID=A0A2H1BVV5_FASHE|nr:Gluconokinase [Fasciola hepatica]TPP62269.1 Gluconokinase [Fasciola gigantica]
MIIVVMGPCGCGKSTIASALAHRLGWLYLDADDYHPLANVQKMAQGIPLEDADRMPWLEKLHEEIVKHECLVLACSALKFSYRKILSQGLEESNESTVLYFVLLRADEDLLRKRLTQRQGNFVHPSLIASQLKTLEPFNTNEWHLTVDASKPCEYIVDMILGSLCKSS